ncbi:helix-turn-helix domain-containing protein [Moraxella nonliquefaciens]|uniref:Helix-turn-helix transcriptional regulator n=1 Tax=Moraxella nonliquefaciens TaxID=478 RepID=A0A7T3BZZ0_MORNO|nr:helix-turn-helix transcriptional regulator [Moraxella nonliquefaciens]QPT45030.1 helix-turn-helix transcriptional regulator [Moraxella nonliquefaciens]QQC30061.1 helix-turn-helix transcriptional regulator [Moraxella nonliquefaciens]
MKTQDKIRAISTQQKISQEQMAERLDLTPQAYSKIESGKNQIKPRPHSTNRPNFKY